MLWQGLVPGASSGLGPCGINCRLDLVFGPMLPATVLYLGFAYKPVGEKMSAVGEI